MTAKQGCKIKRQYCYLSICRRCQDSLHRNYVNNIHPFKQFRIIEFLWDNDQEICLQIFLKFAHWILMISAVFGSVDILENIFRLLRDIQQCRTWLRCWDNLRQHCFVRDSAIPFLSRVFGKLAGLQYRYRWVQTLSKREYSTTTDDDDDDRDFSICVCAVARAALGRHLASTDGESDAIWQAYDFEHTIERRAAAPCHCQFHSDKWALSACDDAFDSSLKHFDVWADCYCRHSCFLVSHFRDNVRAGALRQLKLMESIVDLVAVEVAHWHKCDLHILCSDFLASDGSAVLRAIMSAYPISHFETRRNFLSSPHRHSHDVAVAADVVAAVVAAVQSCWDLKQVKFRVNIIYFTCVFIFNLLFMLPLVVCGQLALVSGYDIAMATLAWVLNLVRFAECSYSSWSFNLMNYLDMDFYLKNCIILPLDSVLVTIEVCRLLLPLFLSSVLAQHRWVAMDPFVEVWKLLLAAA